MSPIENGVLSSSKIKPTIWFSEPVADSSVSYLYDSSSYFIYPESAFYGEDFLQHSDWNFYTTPLSYGYSISGNGFTQGTIEKTSNLKQIQSPLFSPDYPALELWNSTLLFPGTNVFPIYDPVYSFERN
ncbi:MAG: hypothetical protein ACMUJM_17575 [bacterium]